MATRHFEKKGKLCLFRRFATRGPALVLAIGRGGEDEDRFTIRCRSAKAAESLSDVWSRWALGAGYAEVELPAGELGVVAALESPQGPGRIRLDRREDVQFLKSKALALQVGSRVLVTGVHDVKNLRASYMFNSTLRAKGVAAFPTPKWSEFPAAAEPSAAIRKSLGRIAGAAILGKIEKKGAFPRGLVPGALIYSYEKGVHRFLSSGGSKDEYYVTSEPVLTSNFRRQSGPPAACISYYCTPIPSRLSREIGKHFGL